MYDTHTTTPGSCTARLYLKRMIELAYNLLLAEKGGGVEGAGVSPDGSFFNSPTTSPGVLLLIIVVVCFA